MSVHIMSQGDRNMKRAMQWLLTLSVVIAIAVSVRVPAAISFASGDNVGDHAPVFPNFFVRDVLVSNVDRRLQDTDAFRNSEPSIAINPKHVEEIVVSAFSGG